LARLARQGSTSGQQDQAIRASHFGWLRQLATRIAGAGA
jgi:hypothetical protein